MLMFQAGYVLSWSISDNQIIPARASSHIHLSDRLIISVINHHGRNEDLAVGNLPHDTSQKITVRKYQQSDGEFLPIQPEHDFGHLNFAKRKGRGKGQWPGQSNFSFE